MQSIVKINGKEISPSHFVIPSNGTPAPDLPFELHLDKEEFTNSFKGLYEKLILDLKEDDENFPEDKDEIAEAGYPSWVGFLNQEKLVIEVFSYYLNSQFSDIYHKNSNATDYRFWASELTGFKCIENWVIFTGLCEDRKQQPS